MQATITPSETLVKVKVSTTINCMLLQSPDTRYHPFSFCLILQIQLLIRWKTTNSQLRVQICALATYTTKSNWWYLLIKLNFEWELQLVNWTVLKSSQSVHTMLVFHCFFMARNLQTHINFRSLKSHSKFHSGIQMAAFCKYSHGQQPRLFWNITSLSYWLKNRDVQGGHRAYTGIRIPHLLCAEMWFYIYTLHIWTKLEWEAKQAA